MKSRIISISIVLLLFCFLSLISITNVRASDDIFGMSLEELVNIKVTTASGVEESLIDAPAAMIVITSNDI
jgi:iron complex outermembrane receptor protein